jgi:hypothetical protein
MPAGEGPRRRLYPSVILCAKCPPRSIGLVDEEAAILDVACAALRIGGSPSRSPLSSSAFPCSRTWASSSRVSLQNTSQVVRVVSQMSCELAAPSQPRSASRGYRLPRNRPRRARRRVCGHLAKAGPPVSPRVDACADNWPATQNSGVGSAGCGCGGRGYGHLAKRSPPLLSRVRACADNWPGCKRCADIWPNGTPRFVAVGGCADIWPARRAPVRGMRRVSLARLRVLGWSGAPLASDPFLLLAVRRSQHRDDEISGCGSVRGCLSGVTRRARRPRESCVTFPMSPSPTATARHHSVPDIRRSLAANRTRCAQVSSDGRRARPDVRRRQRARHPEVTPRQGGEPDIRRSPRGRAASQISGGHPAAGQRARYPEVTPRQRRAGYPQVTPRQGGEPDIRRSPRSGEPDIRRSPRGRAASQISAGHPAAGRRARYPEVHRGRVASQISAGHLGRRRRGETGVRTRSPATASRRGEPDIRRSLAAGRPRARW